MYELTLHYTQHQDHNVVTGALELLQQLLRTPPPELLRALTTAGGVRQLAASKDEPGGRSRSGSIVELIGRAFGRPLWSPLCRDSAPLLKLAPVLVSHGRLSCLRHRCRPSSCTQGLGGAGG